MSRIGEIARSLTSDLEGDLQFISQNGLKARHHELMVPTLNNLEIRLVDETRQKSGSFKYRGAVLGVRDSRRGVVACGSGNFPIAVGQAASDLAVPALLVMPDDAPERKKQLACQSGPETLFVPRAQFVQTAKEEADARGWNALHPFHDPGMLLGSCTLGIEIAEAIAAFGSPKDAVLVACGGGGLAAGMTIGLRLRGAANPVYVVEPKTHPRLAAARAAGHPIEIIPTELTRCDALRATKIGYLAFDAIGSLDVSLTTATDEGVLAAQSLMAERCKVFAEPSGALALAAVLEGQIPGHHDRVWVVVCGGNT
jgi:threonine dehydratase